MIFYNFCYYFWGNIVDEQKRIKNGKDFFVFYKFPLLSTLLLLILPYSCVPEYVCCVNKLRQNVVYKREYDVI